MVTFIASAEKYKGIIKEDIFIRDYLLCVNTPAEIATLDEVIEKAEPGDVLILKSIWGYHLNYKNFIHQLSIVKEKKVTLVNNFEFILWNIDKSKYINELVNNLEIIPTKTVDFCACNTIENIVQVIEDQIKGFEESSFVIKPSISASGFLTFIYKKGEQDINVLFELLKEKGRQFIIQPFREEIIDGEVSVVLIDGVVMYAFNRYPGVLAQKKELEFIESKKIDAFIINQVELLKQFFLEKFNLYPKICRVDFVKNKSRFELMEVELIDPDLFFKYLPENELANSLSALCSP